MSKTIKDLARDALDVQNASNLSGVISGFSRALADLREHVSGTDALSRHPITVLWSDKVAHLTGVQDLGSAVVSDAYKVVYDLAGR